MSKDNTTVVARYPHAQEEGTYKDIGEIVQRWKDVQVHYEGGVLVEVRTEVSKMVYGSTWDRLYHWSYRFKGDEWVGEWKHTRTFG